MNGVKGLTIDLAWYLGIVMDCDHKALAARLSAAAEQLAAQMRTATLQESTQDWSEFDLTMPQLRTLGFIATQPRRMGEIAANLGSTVSSATSLVERLEGKDLVQRAMDPGDRRVVLCHLTEAGTALIARFGQLQRHRLERATEGLSHDELIKVIEAIELLSGALKRRMETSTLAVPVTSSGSHG